MPFCCFTPAQKGTSNKTSKSKHETSSSPGRKCGRDEVEDAEVNAAGARGALALRARGAEQADGRGPQAARPGADDAGVALPEVDLSGTLWQNVGNV